MEEKDRIWEEVLAEQNVEPVEPEKTSSSLNDLFSGLIITSWEDEEFIYINFPFVCLNMHKEIAHRLAHDLANFAEILLDTYSPDDFSDDE